MRAFANAKGEACEMCLRVPEALFQYWYLHEGEAKLSDRAVRMLPVFCGHACWRRYVDGKQFSDRPQVRAQEVTK